MVGWLFLVWVPMMQRDNEFDRQKAIRDSQAKLDEVRSKLHELQMRNSDGTIPRESSNIESPDTK